MSSATPQLTLVVLSFRRFAQTTGPCLESLLAQPPGPEAELLLVDNASDDGSSELCLDMARRHSCIRYLPQSSNLGFGGGMNVGVAAAQGEWVVLVNSDTLFPAGALVALGRAICAAPAAVAMLGPVTNSAGNGQHLALPDGGLDDAAAIGAAAMHAPTGLLTPTYRTDFFCVAIRRSVWNALGGLDPVFGLGYYEDFDFSLRLRAAGHEQRIAEDVFIVHSGSSSFSTLGDRQRELMARNRALMLQRHPRVRFEHRREGNVLALLALLAHAEQHGWTAPLHARAAWRLAALRDDLPRSPFKRWRWKRSLRSVEARLARAGVVAAYPATTIEPAAAPQRGG